MVTTAVELVRAATTRGHTVLPVSVLRSELARRSGAEVADDALEAPELVPVLWHDAPALALDEVADLEELLADGLAALAAERRLAVAVGADPAARLAAVRAAVPDSVRLRLVEQAHRVGVTELLPVVEDLAEDVVLVLALDPHLPLAPVTGAIALDLAASEVCPVLRAEDPTADGTPARAAAAAAAGTWSGPTEDHAVTAVAVGSPQEASTRVRQLLTDSIPRTFGVAAEQVVVLSAVADGPAGVTGLADTLGRPVRAVPDLARGLGDDADEGDPDPAANRAAAAVVVLGGPDVDRAVLYAGLRSGTRHVSLVHPASLDLAQVAARPPRARRTRLRELLVAAVPGEPVGSQ